MRFRPRFIIVAGLCLMIFISVKLLDPDTPDNLPPECPPGVACGLNEDTIREARQNDLSEHVKSLVAEYAVSMAPARDLERLFDLAAGWVDSRSIHPQDTPQLGSVLNALATAPILKADVAKGGTQLKMALKLDGNQLALFKPKRYERDTVIEGKSWDGGDRHNGEIAAFHLDRLLGFHRVPLAVGRYIDMEKEIRPIGSQTLLNTFFMKDGNTCFYGKCLYCKGPGYGVCANKTIMEGTMILWLPMAYKTKTLPHPWRRSYTERVMRWEKDDQYCVDEVLHQDMYNSGPRLLDLLDTTVFDYLILNGDRHHYHVFDGYEDTIVVLLDNGKSFSNPHMDDKTILAPLDQCCLIRNRTYQRLQQFTGGVMSRVLEKVMSSDPISPILSRAHLNALDRRLEHIIQHIRDCIIKFGEQNVLLNDRYTQPVR